MNDKYCEHCWPTKRRSHFLLHFDYYLEKIIATISKPLKYFKKSQSLQNHFLVIFLDLLSFVKIVSFEEEPDESKLYNRSLIFLKEAKKRGLDVKTVKVLGKYIDEFKLIHKNKKYYYEGIPLTLFEKTAFEIDDKDYVKKYCKKITYQ